MWWFTLLVVTLVLQAGKGLGLVIPKVESSSIYFDLKPCQEQLMKHSNTQRYWDSHDYIMSLRLDEVGIQLFEKEMSNISRGPKSENDSNTNNARGILLTRENLHLDKLDQLGLRSMGNISRLFDVSGFKEQFHSIEPIVIPINTTGLFLFNKMGKKTKEKEKEKKKKSSYDIKAMKQEGIKSSSIKLLDYFLFLPLVTLERMNITTLNNTHGNILFYENGDSNSELIMGESPVLISLLQEAECHEEDEDTRNPPDADNNFDLINSKWMRITHNDYLSRNRFCTISHLNDSLCFRVDDDKRGVQVSPLFDSRTHRMILSSNYFNNGNVTNVRMGKRYHYRYDQEDDYIIESMEPLFKIQVIKGGKNSTLTGFNDRAQSVRNAKQDDNRAEAHNFENLIFKNMRQKDSSNL